MEIKCNKGGDECYGLSEMTLLFDISQRFMQSKQLKNDLDSILKMVVDYLEAERSFLSIFNRENSKIYIESAYGLSSSQQARGKYELGEGITGRVVEMARPVVIDKISKSSLFLNKMKQDLSKEGEELSFICVPIMLFIPIIYRHPCKRPIQPIPWQRVECYIPFSRLINN